MSFLITCGRSLTAVGKDGKKRTFNDIWFPSYYFYQENKEVYPFCQGLKLNQNGFTIWPMRCILHPYRWLHNFILFPPFEFIIIVQTAI